MERMMKHDGSHFETITLSQNFLEGQLVSILLCTELSAQKIKLADSSEADRTSEY